jgi:hypothetical protein
MISSDDSKPDSQQGGSTRFGRCGKCLFTSDILGRYSLFLALTVLLRFEPALQMDFEPAYLYAQATGL